MRTEITKKLVENLNESVNVEFVENVNNIVYGLVSSAIENLSKKSAFVKSEKCVLLPVNEVSLCAVCQNSTYDYFLGIDNPQIAINSTKMKNLLRFAWREFRAAWRLGKKKYRKVREQQVKSSENIEKYKLSDFRRDVLEQMSEFLSPTTILYEHTQKISIVGKEDFGSNVKVNIYVSVYDSASGDFKIYIDRKNKFIGINFGSRFENLEAKKEKCGESFVNMVKIFNAIFSNIYNRIPNQILLESLLFACPDNLYSDDVFNTFVNIANYIRLADAKSIPSICDNETPIFKDKLFVSSQNQTDFGKLIKMLDNFKM